MSEWTQFRRAFKQSDSDNSTVLAGTVSPDEIDLKIVPLPI